MRLSKLRIPGGSFVGKSIECYRAFSTPYLSKGPHAPLFSFSPYLKEIQYLIKKYSRYLFFNSVYTYTKFGTKGGYNHDGINSIDFEFY